jgi:N-acetylglutamate synthase-like GNAT family acetyltransferase
MGKLKIREITKKDNEWIKEKVVKSWGSDIIVSRGKVHIVTDLKGYVGVIDNQIAGLLSYNIEDKSIEIVLLESFVEGAGVGSALIEKVKEKGTELGVEKIWLITSNDNLDALAFYQKRGFRLSAIYRDAINEARKIKPQIPKIGDYDIPIMDEIELEFILNNK